MPGEVCADTQDKPKIKQACALTTELCCDPSASWDEEPHGIQSGKMVDREAGDIGTEMEKP